MSIQDNTTALQEILETVNALPEAGSGGASVETCDITITISKGGSAGVSFYAISYSVTTISTITGTGYYKIATNNIGVVNEYPTTITATVPKGSIISVWYANADNNVSVTVSSGMTVNRHIHSLIPTTISAEWSADILVEAGGTIEFSS